MNGVALMGAAAISNTAYGSPIIRGSRLKADLSSHVPGSQTLYQAGGSAGPSDTGSFPGSPCTRCSMARSRLSKDSVSMILR